jgi:hypothetical protein
MPVCFWYDIQVIIQILMRMVVLSVQIRENLIIHPDIKLFSYRFGIGCLPIR